MDNIPGSSSDPIFPKMVILNTDQLLSAYPDTFEEVINGNQHFYIEKRTKESQVKDHRYISTKTFSDRLPEGIQDKTKPQHLVSITGNCIWNHLFTPKDLDSIYNAILKIQFEEQSDNEKVEYIKDVSLEDGSTISMELIHYFPENTEQIVRELNNVDVAE